MDTVLTPWQSLSRIKPYAHQVVGTELIVKNPYFFLADEMGAGKTKQTIDAAHILYTNNEIDRIIVVCPASVRSVWYDQELGEIAKHAWDTVNNTVLMYHGKIRKWYTIDTTGGLTWIITNYDFIRSQGRLEQLYQLINTKTMLVLDESSAVKNPKAKQTRSCLSLRKFCRRVLLLNGTPIANSPGDMYSQGNIMDPRILGCKSYFHFRARYAQMGGWQGRVIVGWHDIDDMQRKFAPYIIRRLKTDCLDLPPKLSPVTLTATLTDETWKLYKEMRDEMVAWLDEQNVSVTTQVIVKALRLAQLTSGFIGGIEKSGVDEGCLQYDFSSLDYDGTENRPSWLDPAPGVPSNPAYTPVKGPGTPPGDPEAAAPIGRVGAGGSGLLAGVQEVGSEKLLMFLDWVGQQLENDKKLKLLVWARFRPELARLIKNLETLPVALGAIHGGQKKQERDAALRLLDPRTMPDGPVIVVGTPSSGSMGINLSGAHTVVYMSNDYSLKTRLQSEDRVHRPGQVYPVSYYDVMAVGPKGQKTIDHTVIKALRNKESVANWTTAAWRQVLTSE